MYGFKKNWTGWHQFNIKVNYNKKTQNLNFGPNFMSKFNGMSVKLKFYVILCELKILFFINKQQFLVCWCLQEYDKNKFI